MAHVKYGRDPMTPFDYSAPGSLDEVCALLAGAGGRAKVLAGGTDLLIELRRPGKKSPERIVDISRIDPLRGVELQAGSVRIGPLTTHAEIAESGLIRETAGLLAAASGAVGSPQVRNRGTIGGNIMNAATCADTVPPLVALNARLTLVSSRGQREVPITDFFIEPYRTVALQDEVLSLIAFSSPPAGTRGSFTKLGRRNAVSISRLSVAALVTRDAAGTITAASIVPGAAMPVWQRVSEAESLLLGEKPSSTLFAAAGRKVSEVMIRQTGRRWSTEYKEPVLAVLVRRALEACCTSRERAPESAK